MPWSHGSRPEYDVSRCPLNISVGPPPVPAHVPSTFARPSSTSCHCTWRPRDASSSRISSAAACSDPVNDGVDTSRIASSTSRRSSIIGPAAARARRRLELAVPVLAPELEHDVRAAGLAVLLDRRDAVVGRPGDRLAAVEQGVGHLLLRRQPPAALHRLGHGRQLVHLDLRELEKRVGRALDVLELVRQVHGRDLTGAVSAGVAVRLGPRRRSCSRCRCPPARCRGCSGRRRAS